MFHQPADRIFRRLNMELLIIFSEVMATRHAKLAADNLELTQSAVSHGIRRLSDIVGERLFVRDRFTFTPTLRASEMSPVVDTIVASARSILVLRTDEA